jgi:hypothetical protein
MKSFTGIKEVKKGLTSPLKISENSLKTPEKPKTSKNPLPLKKSAVKTKPVAFPKKIAHAKSFSQIGIIDEVKQDSLKIIQGIEKMRRILSFSRYRYCFEIIKLIFQTQNISILSFIRLKTMYKVLEALKTHKKTEEVNEINEIIDDYTVLVLPQSNKGVRVYNNNLLTKSLNGILSFYCQSTEMSQMISEFYYRKLLHRSFEALSSVSKYDGVIEYFIKVLFT